MLTELELRKVNELVKEKGKLQGMISNLESTYINRGVGIVTIMSTTKVDNDTTFLHQHFPDIVNELKEQALKLLKSKLLHVEADLSKYIKPE